MLMGATRSRNWSRPSVIDSITKRVSERDAEQKLVSTASRARRDAEQELVSATFLQAKKNLSIKRGYKISKE